MKKQLPAEIKVYGSVASGDFDEYSDLDLKIKTHSNFREILKIILNDREVFGEEFYEGVNQRLYRFWLEDGKKLDIKFSETNLKNDENLNYKKTTDSKRFWFLLVTAAHKFIRKDSFVSIDLYLKSLQMVLDKQWDENERVRVKVEKIIRTLTFEKENFIKNLAKIGKCWSVISDEKEQLKLFRKQYLKQN